jgi:hypothetical protein
MHKRTLLVVAPLCVAALAAGVALAAPIAAEPEDPHAVRPIAASPQDPTTFSTQSLDDVLGAANAEHVRQVMLEQVAAFVRGIEAARIAAYLDSIAAAQAAAAQAAAAQAAAARARPAANVAQSAGTRPAGTGGVLDCIKQRESGGDYTVHNSQGSGASGAYQFLPGTWNSIAESSGRSDLVGMDPAEASPADQDAMAAELYAQQGSAPWGGAC